MELATDYIVLFVLFISFLLGFLNGFFKTVIGPISIILGWIIGVTFYYKTDRLITSLIISIAIPIIIKVLFFFFYRPKKQRKNAVKKFYLVGRLAGGSFSLFWYGSITCLLLVIITLLPIEKNWYKTIKDSVTQSTSYSLINRIAGDKIKEFSQNNTNIFEIFQNEETLEKTKDTSEFKDIMNHKKIKALFKDEESVKQLEDKDFASLISNPKIMEIIKDNALIKKFLSLNKKMGDKDTGNVSEKIIVEDLKKEDQ